VIEWFTYLQLAVAVAAGLLCLGLGFAGRKPTDLSMGAAALVELHLPGQRHPAATGRGSVGAHRTQPLEHGDPGRRLPVGGRDGLPDAADLDRAGRLSARPGGRTGATTAVDAAIITER
jgi:hypothetical protein